MRSLVQSDLKKCQVSVNSMNLQNNRAEYRGSKEISNKWWCFKEICIPGEKHQTYSSPA